MAQVEPSGDIFFPLASNAHALVAGSPVASVRARLKLASILYDRVLIESGNMIIQAGPTGASTWRHPVFGDDEGGWQTPAGRRKAQAAPISVAMAIETQPGVPAPGPYAQVVRSETTICWLPRLEPFARELSAACDWIEFGVSGQLPTAFDKLAETWKRYDERNEALSRLVPVKFVRSTLVDHVSRDLAIGAAGGWEVSVDRLHGRVLDARFRGDATMRVNGFALPILVPAVGGLGWDDVAAIRRLKPIERLRKVLREIEAEAYAMAAAGATVDRAVRQVYDRKVRAAVGPLDGVRSIAGHAIVNVVLGVGSGYATLGMKYAGPVVGGVAGAAITAVLETQKVVRQRRTNGWVGVMGEIAERITPAAPAVGHD